MSSTYLDATGTAPVSQPPAPARTEIVFIEDNVADVQSLARQLGNGREVVILDSTGDGLHQIAEALAGRAGIDALHIVSHGAPGAASLGALTLDAADAGAHQADLDAIGRSMAGNGDILLYGCDTGAGSAGQALVDRIARATGADVAASNDLTGSAALGGDWQLEVTSGAVETASLGAAGLRYDHVLSVLSSTQVNVTFDPIFGYSWSQSSQGYDVFLGLDQNGTNQLHLHADNYVDIDTDSAQNNYVNGHAVTGHPTEVSMDNGKLFSVTSLDLAVNNPPFPMPGAVNVTITGLDADGHTVGSKTVTLAYSFGPTVMPFQTVTFDGMTNIAKLTFVVADNPFAVGNVHLDNLALTNIHVPSVAPTTTNTSVAFSNDTGISNHDLITHTAQQTLGGTLSAALATGEHVEVSLDNGANWTTATAATGASAWSLNTTLAGSGTLQVRVADDNGNTGAADSHAYVLDTTAPTVAITSDAATLKAGETATITFTFSEDPGATFTWDGAHGDVVVSGGTLGAISGSGPTRTATFTPDAGTDGGTASITVAGGGYTDTAGNGGGAGSAPALTFDTLAPDAPLAHMAPLSDSGDLPLDGITNVTTPTFDGLAEPGATVTLYDTNGAVLGSTVAANGAWSITTSTLADGEHTITARASDAAGNVGAASAGIHVTVDTTAPSAPSTPALDAASDTGVSHSDGITADTTPTFTGTAETGATVNLYEGGTLLGSTVAVGGAWSITSAMLGAGQHTVTATAIDAAGNAGVASNGTTFTIDTTAPTTTIGGLAFSADSGASATDFKTNVAAQVIGGSLSAPLEPGERVEVSVDNGASWTTAQVSGTTWSAAATLLSGARVVQARVVDAVDNAGPTAIHAYALDTTAPGAPAAPQLQAQSDTGPKGDGVTYAAPVLQGTAAANDLVTVYDGATAVGTTHADADGHWTFATHGLGLGRHTLSATDTDAAGNVSAPGAAFALTVVEAPVPLVDGVAVVTVPVILPDGTSGSQIQVPIVNAGRVESTGAAATADIPLAANDLLVAHVATGYGLTGTGGAGLIAAIRAASSANASDDQAHLTGNGQSYLGHLASNDALLVQTIAPVGGDASGALALSANTGTDQHVALVIQTGGMAPGGTIQLQNIDFAAIVGSANVVAQGGTQILTGDGASQSFTVAAGSTQLFAGGGADTMRFGLSTPASADGTAHADMAATPTVTVLHGGSGDDTAVFDGARADFDVEIHRSYLMVSRKGAPQAQAMVVNTEHLQFSDTTVTMQHSADESTLAGLYQAVLGRQADVHGFEYWADVHDNGLGLGAVALDLIGSSERLATRGGFTGDVGHDVGLLYAGLFDRAADTAGLAFWTQAVQHGATLAQVADAMLQSVEMVGQQGAPLDWNFSV